MIESSYVIAALLAVLCCLAGLDLWRQTALKSEETWFTQYTQAVKYSDDFWKLGYRLEDLDIKIDFQHTYWLSIKHQIDTALSPKFKLDRNTLRQNTNNIAYTRQSRIALHNLLQNDSSVYQIRCGTDGALLRIGVNDFRTDSRDACQLFTANVASDPKGAHTMFDLEPSEDGSFALRSVANGRFVKTVPPPADNPVAPWKLIIGGPLVGSAEKFRFTEDGKLYSALMGERIYLYISPSRILPRDICTAIGGFFNCGGSGQMVSGTPGEYSQYNSKAFIMEKLSTETVRDSYGLVDLSRQIVEIQSRHTQKHQKSPADRKSAALGVTGLANQNTVKICLGVPITSKGTDMKTVADSPFWSNLFDSFMKSVDWRSNRYVFRFYLGFDKADALYDTGDAWSELREEFQHRATYRMMEQLMDEAAINTVLAEQLSLKLMHFDHLEGAPSQVVSQLMLSAYMDNFDYFYQVPFTRSYMNSVNLQVLLKYLVCEHTLYPYLVRL
jgi:hypothetical protein